MVQNFGVYAICPVCHMERKTLQKTKRLAKHNMWTGTEMVPCEGAGRLPPRRGK